MNIQKLNEVISKECPIYGVSSDGRIDFKLEATEVQKAAAQEIMASYLSDPGNWQPEQSANEVLEAAMRKCEAHFESEGFTAFRVQDLFADLLDEAVATERKARILVIKNWLRECRNATTCAPAGVLDGSVDLPVAPLRYAEV